MAQLDRAAALKRSAQPLGRSARAESERQVRLQAASLKGLVREHEWRLVMGPIEAAPEAAVGLLEAGYDRRQNQKFRSQERGLLSAVPKLEMSKVEAVVVYQIASSLAIAEISDPLEQLPPIGRRLSIVRQTVSSFRSHG